MKQSTGINRSEEKINRYCHSLFLNLWTLQNPYKEVGKELCDTLIICDDKVVIFSVKNSKFMDASELKGVEKMSTDIQNEKYEKLKIEWDRWYKKAVEKSKKQLLGAEKWLRTNPEEIYSDVRCTKKIPLLKIPDNPKFYLVAVADGLSNFIKNSLGEDLGTFALSSQEPMMQGPGFIKSDINKGGSFVHVFEEDAIDILFDEFDTISDFLDYLDAREGFWRSIDVVNRLVTVVGEEEFVGLYFQSYNQANNKYEITLHDESEGKDYSTIAIDRGFWDNYVNKIKPDRQMQNKDSYIIDEYVYHYGRAILNNKLDITTDHTYKDIVQVLKLIVLESRLARRGITEMIKRGINMHIADTKRSVMYKNFLLSDREKGTAYVFLQIRPYLNFKSPKEYLDFQMLCFQDQALLLRERVEEENRINSSKVGEVKYIIGFLSHPLNSLDEFKRSAHLVMLDCSEPLSEKDLQLIKELKANGLGITSSPKYSIDREFDVPK